MERETHYTYAILDGQTVTHADCFLAAFSDEPCDGRMQKAHLIRQQTIRREAMSKDMEVDLWDSRAWRPACYRHHVALDQSKRLRVPRSAIPVETEQYAAELGLGWWLSRSYGELEDVAA